MNFLKANEPFLISALIILLGYLLKRLKVLKEDDGETLAKVALNVTLPAVILLTVPNVELSRTTAILPLAALMMTGLTISFAAFFFRNQPREYRGLSMTASSGYNNGLFAMPMVAGIYGAAGIARFALLDVGNVISVFITANYLAWRYSPLHDEIRLNPRRMAGMFLKSVPFLSYIAAVTMNLAGWSLSEFSREYLGVVAGMNRGAALLALGILLRFRFEGDTGKTIFPALALRYTFGIAAAAIVLFLVPLPLAIRTAIAGIVVMPMGLTLIPYAARWGYSREKAAAIINLGIPVSFVLFWIVWLVGRFLESR